MPSALALAELHLRWLMAGCSQQDWLCMQALSRLPDPDRHAAIACWLRPPAPAELDTMPPADADVARQLWRIRCASIAALADVLRDRLGVADHVAADLAMGIAGIIDLHRRMAGRWRVSERSYYRLVHRASRIVGEMLYRVVERVAALRGADAPGSEGGRDG